MEPWSSPGQKGSEAFAEVPSVGGGLRGAPARGGTRAGFCECLGFCRGEPWKAHSRGRDGLAKSMVGVGGQVGWWGRQVRGGDLWCPWEQALVAPPCHQAGEGGGGASPRDRGSLRSKHVQSSRGTDLYPQRVLSALTGCRVKQRGWRTLSLVGGPQLAGESGKASRFPEESCHACAAR